MSLFNGVGGISNIGANFGVKKAEPNYETKNIGIISFKFEKLPFEAERAIVVFGEEDADFAMEFNHLASDFDPEANSL